MPEISRFYGIVIRMFYDEHNPPHFHVQYGEFNAVLKINDQSLLEGYLPPRALGLVIEWANIHRAELLKDWELARENTELFKIEPLKQEGKMYYEVVDFELLNEYKIRLRFKDGKSGVIDFNDYLNKGGIFSKFSDFNFFIISTK